MAKKPLQLQILEYTPGFNGVYDVRVRFNPDDKKVYSYSVLSEYEMRKILNHMKYGRRRAALRLLVPDEVERERIEKLTRMVQKDLRIQKKMQKPVQLVFDFFKKLIPKKQPERRVKQS